MFDHASQFSCDLRHWDVSKVTRRVEGFDLIDVTKTDQSFVSEKMSRVDR
jgi:hypothetical protein